MNKIVKNKIPSNANVEWHEHNKESCSKKERIQRAANFYFSLRFASEPQVKYVLKFSS